MYLLTLQLCSIYNDNDIHYQHPLIEEANIILIYSLIIVTVLAFSFTSSIKKQYRVYYSLAALLAILTSVYEILRIISNVKLHGFISNLEKASIQGNISISFFILVMFAGALGSKWGITKKLLSIRAQLAILGSIFILPHGIIYLARFILLKLPNIIKQREIPILYLGYLVVGIIAFIILIPLFSTSLNKFRSKMSGLKWKQIQRWAYCFYFLAYIHIILMLLNKKELDWMKLIIYTAVFGLYAVLRVIKAKKIKLDKLNKAA